MSAVIFAKSPYKNEVFVKGSNVNMQKYVKFCKANTKIKDLKESPGRRLECDVNALC